MRKEDVMEGVWGGGMVRDMFIILGCGFGRWCLFLKENRLVTWYGMV